MQLVNRRRFMGGNPLANIDALMDVDGVILMDVDGLYLVADIN
jgi:hypothetical protein